MKKCRYLLGVALASLLVSATTSCNSKPTVVETTDLKEVINLFNESGSYDITSSVPVATSKFANGFNTTIASREDAIECTFSDLTTGAIASSYGYADYNLINEDGSTKVGTMEYSYDENGDIVPGYIIDANHDVKTSKKVDLGLKSISMPNSLRNGDLEYVLSTGFTSDKLLINQIVSAAVPGMSVDVLKSYGTFAEENGIVLSTDGEGKTLDLVFTYEADADSAANGSRVRFSIGNIGTETTLDITNYIANGGKYKEVCDEAYFLQELSWCNYVCRIDSTDYNGDGINDGGIEFLYNAEYGYVGYLYDDQTTEFEIYDDGKPTGKTTRYQNSYFIPVYGKVGVTNNFYVATQQDDGSIDLSLDDLTTFSDENAVYTVETSQQYFTSYEKMISYMASGLLSPVPYLFLFPGIDDDEMLYALGDYYVDDTDGLYGFASTDATLASELDSIVGYTKNGYAKEYGELLGPAYLFDRDVNTIETQEDLEQLALSIGMVTENGILTFRYKLTGWNSERTSFSPVNDILIGLYPELAE